MPDKQDGRKNNGGKRKGAGRKPKPNGKLSYGTRLSPDVIEYLRQCDNAAETIEQSIKNSSGYKQWAS